jgi:hypothetical protein
MNVPTILLVVFGSSEKRKVKCRAADFVGVLLVAVVVS